MVVRPNEPFDWEDLPTPERTVKADLIESLSNLPDVPDTRFGQCALESE